LQASHNHHDVFLSVVVPVFNESGNIETLYSRVLAVLDSIHTDWELIIVCDGSTDGTDENVSRVREKDKRVKLIRLSRNFGHQAALSAGLDHASGSIVVTMDGDLQHPPESIPEMIQQWQKGFDIVHASRRVSTKPSILQRFTQRFAYSLLRQACDVDIIRHAADFRLFDRRALDAYLSLEERTPFHRGMTRWIGFRQTVITYAESNRHAGQPRFTMGQSMKLLADGFFGLSRRPLSWYAIAALLCPIFMAGALLAVNAGTTMWLAALCTLSALQGGGLWIVGEYVIRSYEESRRRPRYIIESTSGFAGDVRAATIKTARDIPSMLNWKSGPNDKRSTRRSTPNSTAGAAI
jgi:dolichol-phosphate mannosyltransferase